LPRTAPVVDHTFVDIYSVSQVASYLRELFETDVHLSDLWVSGEVSNLSRPPSGHLYFTLKDARASLRCVLFRGAYGVRAAHGIENGQQVVAHGRVSLYEPRGDLQMIVDFVQPEGLGAQQLEIERLKAQLEQEGLFAPERKRALPRFPRRIGVATSPAGAVLHDICHVLERRWPLAEIVLAPTPVQGPEAADGVVEAIRALNREPGIDVIIVARGGGSLEELAPFNSEAVARAIYASAVPVVSAVGHETDTTIADLVADVRAPTPSAAAEIVAPDRRQLGTHLGVRAATMESAVRARLRDGRRAVESCVSRLGRSEPDFARLRQSVDERSQRAGAALDAFLRHRALELGGHRWRLRSLDPLATLERGYAIVQRDGHVVSSVHAVRPGEPLGVRVRDGTFGVRVEGPGHPAPRARRPRARADQPPLFTVPEAGPA
jgi:exodeoxyribonuclease VII large subunit